MLISNLKTKIDHLSELGVPEDTVQELRDIATLMEKEYHADIDRDIHSELSDIPIANKNDHLNAFRSVPDTYNILLVDDSEDSVQMVKLALKSLPYKIDVAQNGAIGVEKFKTNIYNLVLMDVQMPVMNGYEATRQIREWEQIANMKRTPIIAATANSFPGARERSIDVGCDDYLIKPVDMLILIHTIKKYIYFSIFCNRRA